MVQIMPHHLSTNKTPKILMNEGKLLTINLILDEYGETMERTKLEWLRRLDV
jgi:hypothetical protein